ncbi:MAG: EthD domain-containing protein [Pseudomonadota bacterium]
MIKLMFCLRRLPALDRAAFQAYWRERHAPLVARHAAAMRLRRYVQCHTVDDPVAASLAAARGAPPAFDGVAELWWDSLDDRAAARGAAVRAAAAELLADERQFIDLSASPLFLVAEHGVLPAGALLQPLGGSPFQP